MRNPSTKSANISTKKCKALFSCFFEKIFGGYLRTARPNLSVVFVFDFFAIQEFCYLTPGFSRFGWLCLSRTREVTRLQRSYMYQSRARLVSTNNGRCYWALRCFAAPQSFLMRFALRLWQLNSRFAASSAPKLQLFPLTNAPWK